MSFDTLLALVLAYLVGGVDCMLERLLSMDIFLQAAAPAVGN